MRVLLLGSRGHLGAAVAARFAPAWDVTATSRADLDVRDHVAVRRAIERLRPDAVVNCTAYTAVDRAEDEPVEALAVNGFAVRVMAAAAESVGAAFVHYSTDFVFDGTGDRPHTEEDAPNPRSVYASSKLIGEWLAREASRHYVLRVESVFGEPPSPGARRTSVDGILDRVAAGEEVAVFADRTVSPSFRDDVAAATRALLERRAAPGLYHCVNSGSCTWEELALEAARLLAVEPRLKPIAMAEAGLRAARPLYCALSNRKLAEAGVVMPSWQDALARCLAARRSLGPSRP